jgi:solute carrier family 25 protein 16
MTWAFLGDVFDNRSPSADIQRRRDASSASRPFHDAFAYIPLRFYKIHGIRRATSGAFAGLFVQPVRKSDPLILQKLMPTPDKVTGPRLFAAGAMAGVTSVFLTYPLELIRVRLAYDRRLPASQLQGHSVLVYSILKIYHEGDPSPRNLNIVGTPLQPPVPSPSHTLGSLQYGSHNAALHPSPYFKNPSKAVVVASSLFARFPVLKFYRGFVVSVIGMVPYAGTSFLVWGYLKKKTRRTSREGEKQKSDTLANLACGAVAGATAQTASYPFEVVRRRMQVGGILRPDRFFGFWETVSFIYKNKGIRGFWVGLTIGYLKVVPLTAISFASWEAIKKIMKV